jgi:hypothetical protein
MIVLSRGKIAEKHAYYAVNTSVLVDSSALLEAKKGKTVSRIFVPQKRRTVLPKGNLLLFSYHSSAMPQGKDRAEDLCRFDINAESCHHC